VVGAGGVMVLGGGCVGGGFLGLMGEGNGFRWKGVGGAWGIGVGVSGAVQEGSAGCGCGWELTGEGFWGWWGGGLVAVGLVP